ncbi:hypothetical protein LCGC14_1439950 [marine sediment metagenome]|uniref:Uncharacterized protein n=1 Tax=marine sediment metagenome TaxID=412755 RepID=A0A0F9JLI7_9ZZZZ
MKIYNYVRFDMDTGKTIEEDSFEYSGPVGLCQQDSGWGEPETGIDDPAGAWDTQNQAGHDIHDMIQEWEKAGYTWKEGLKDFAKVGVISPIAGVVYTAYRSYATGKERDAALSKGLKDIGFSDQQASNMQSQVRNQGWRNAINSISGGGDATPESYAMSGYTTGLNKDVFGNLQGRDWSMLSDKEWARRYSLNPEQARQAFRKYTNRGELPDSIIKLAEGLEGGRGAVGPTGEGTGTPTDGGGTYEAIVPGNDGSPITEASIKKYFNQILGRNPSAQEIQDRISQASTYGSDPTTPQNNNWLIRELSKSDEGKAYAARGGGGGGVGTPGAPPAPTGPPTAEEMYERYNMPGAATSGLVDRSSGWGSWDQSPQQQFTLTRQESGGFQAPPGAQQNAFTRQESGGFQAPPGATPKTGEPGPNALSPRAIPQTDAGPYQDARNVFDYSTGVIDTTMDRGMNAINRGVGQMRGDITTGMGQMRGDITTGMNQMMAEFTQAEQKAEAALKQALATGRGDVTTALQQVTQEMRPYGMAGEKALQNVMGMIKSGVPSMEEFRKSRTYQSPLEEMT